MRTFRSSRRRVFGVVACAVLAMGPWASGTARGEESVLPGSCKLHGNKVVNPGCVPALAEQVEGSVDEALAYGYTYPDLVPDVTETYVQRPVLGYDFEAEEFIYGEPELFFDTYSQNLGKVAVDIQSDDPANVINPAASQCVAWEPQGVCRERRTVGGFELHPTHGHIHFQDFADYELRRLQADGTPDYTAAGLVGESDKVSFCLIDSTQVAPDAFPVPTYHTCTGTREGITAGWADIYSSNLDGQQIDLTGLADGRYALVISMNTGGHLYESSYANNRLAVTVELGGLAGLTPTATIVSRHWS